MPMDPHRRAYDFISLRIFACVLKICGHLCNLRINFPKKSLDRNSPAPHARNVANVFLERGHDRFVASQAF
jgi:hypothetical protein